MTDKLESPNKEIKDNITPNTLTDQVNIPQNNTTNNNNNQINDLSLLNDVNQNINLLNSNDGRLNQNFTFKIIKRRTPWNKKEDDAIVELVKKYGTSNWTIIADEMALINKSKHRNGKQCRERWHNHLDPIVNKDNWTEEEENILFSKHLEYGNKWSDIAKYLPGRTDNSIKNHFYSKLRKFIRKMLKQINKENLLKNNGIDNYKYNSDKVYKLLKKYKITYKNVTKDTILDLIISAEKNPKAKVFDIIDKYKTTNNNSNQSNNSGINNSSSICSNNDDSENKGLIQKNNSEKKQPIKKFRTKSKQKNDHGFIVRKDKKLFKTGIVLSNNNNITQNNINNNNNVNLNNTIENKEIINKSSSKIKTKKEYENEPYDKIKIKPEKKQKSLSVNKNLNKESSKIKNKLQKTNSIKENINAKKLLNKKRRRKKRRKVTISLSTPENKKTQISRIMPKRKFVFGLGQKIPIDNNNSRQEKRRRTRISVEDFDPTINEVEIVREGMEIHYKNIIVLDKSLLTENLFPNNNYKFRPPIEISIPTSPRYCQFPTPLGSKTKNGMSYSFIQNDENKNIGLNVMSPVNYNDYYEGQPSPMNVDNIIMYPPSSKNIYNVDLSNENNFLKGRNFYFNNFNINYNTTFTPNNFMGGFMQPTTPNKEALNNKILVQNNNINIDQNTPMNNLTSPMFKNYKKPLQLNLDFLDQPDNNGTAFGGNMQSNTNKNPMISPRDMFRLSPTSAFMPK